MNQKDQYLSTRSQIDLLGQMISARNSEFDLEKREIQTGIIRNELVRREGEILESDIIESRTIQSICRTSDLEAKRSIQNNLKSMIREIILSTAQVLKFAEKTTDFQATILANDLFEVMKAETIEDIYLMFARARQGYYGNLGGRLDSSTIFGQIVPKHLEWKAELRERKHLKGQGEFKRLLSNDNTDEANECLKTNIERFNAMIEYISKQRKERKQKQSEEFERKIQEFSTDKRSQHEKYIEWTKQALPDMQNYELLRELQRSDKEDNLIREFYEIYKTEIQERRSKGTWKDSDIPKYREQIIKSNERKGK